MNRSRIYALCLIVATLVPGLVWAQAPSRTASGRDVEPKSNVPAVQLLRTVVDVAHIDNATAREALQWWSSATNIALVVNWAELENEGVDPEATVNLSLRRIPADMLLKLIINQMSPEVPLIVETTQWFVQVMTRNQAVRKPVVKVYDIRDLLFEVPNFDNAPDFDLNSALDNTSSGGSGTGTGRSSGSSSGGGSSGGGGTIFDTEDDNNERDRRATKEERTEDLVQLIRETIEPDIWQAHGGQLCSIKDFDGRLIVNAPMFVHRQLGMPAIKTGSKRSAARTRVSSAYGASPRTHDGVYRPYWRPGGLRRGGVSGVRPYQSTRVAGVARY